MTTITLEGRKVTLTIEQKAHLLQVFEIGEDGRLAVTSGSKLNTAYVVRYIPGAPRTHYCPCESFAYCSHRQAADWYLEAKAREQYVQACGIYQ